jgi:hypothetical protein
MTSDIPGLGKEDILYQKSLLAGGFRMDSYGSGV